MMFAFLCFLCFHYILMVNKSQYHILNILHFLNIYDIIYFNNKCKEVLTYTDLDSFYTDYGINPKDKKTYILKLRVAPNREIT